MTRNFRSLCLAAAALTLAAPASAWAFDGVVASIKPVHSLVAAVMEGVGEPALIVRGTGSEHVYSLRPSDAAALEAAKVVFWVGRGMETFLEGPLETLAAGATVVALEDTPGLEKLDFREGGPFEAHTHDDHGHDHNHGHGAEAGHDDRHDHDDHGHGHAAEGGHDHDGGHGHHDHADDGHRHDEGHGAEAGHDDRHGHDDHDHGHGHAAEGGHHDGHDHDGGHGHHDHAHDAHGHDHGHGHAHGAYDLHFWLDPVNAKALVAGIEAVLSEADPDNAERYRANAQAYAERLDALVSEIDAQVAPVRGRPAVVFHDAYQYFEHRFGINVVGSITVSPEVMPGAQRVAEIKARIQELDAACVFAEPQFEPRLVSVVTEGTGAKTGVLDPLGAELEDGPELYVELLRNLATSLTTCLSETG